MNSISSTNSCSETMTEEKKEIWVFPNGLGCRSVTKKRKSNSRAVGDLKDRKVKCIDEKVENEIIQDGYIKFYKIEEEGPEKANQPSSISDKSDNQMEMQDIKENDPPNIPRARPTSFNFSLKARRRRDSVTGKDCLETPGGGCYFFQQTPTEPLTPYLSNENFAYPITPSTPRNIFGHSGFLGPGSTPTGQNPFNFPMSPFQQTRGFGPNF